MRVVRAALRKAGLKAADLAAVGITNQRETTLLWDRVTGKPVHRAIVWQDRRTAPLCEELRARGLEDTVRGKTGLVIDPYFSGTKLQWLFSHLKTARRRAKRLAFGTIDSWLVWKLTGGRVHATDASARRRFAAYWRVIYPGSALIRRMWLRAIRVRAEASPARVF